MEKTLHISISGDFITRIARSWFWDENRPYEKSEALLLCALNGNGLSEDEMKVICRDIIEGRKKLTGNDVCDLVDDGVKIRLVTEKLNSLQKNALELKIRDDIIAHPLNYIDRFAMTKDYFKLVDDIDKNHIDGSYEGIRDYVSDSHWMSEDPLRFGLWLFDRPDLIAEFNDGPLPEQVDNPDFYKSGFWAKLSDWIDKNMKGYAITRRQKNYQLYIGTYVDKQKFHSPYGLVSPNGEWYDCGFGEHTGTAGKIILKHPDKFGMTAHKAFEIAYDCYAGPLDFLYEKGWVALRNPDMGNPYLDMAPDTKPTKEQEQTIFEYIEHFGRYDMDITKIIDNEM